MAATKSAVTVQASETNTAGSTKTGSSVDLTTAYGMGVTWRVTNGATGPTVACDCAIEVSADNSDWYEIARYTSATGNNVITEGYFEIAPTVMYMRTIFEGNTGQTVTVEAEGHKITAI